MNLNRRSFLAASALGTAGVPSLLAATPGNEGHARPPGRIKLGISTYSYWHFKTAKVPIETVIDKAAGIGVNGVDILHRQMELPEKEPLDAPGRAYLRKLKRHAFVNGVDLICVSTHQTFVSPKPDEVAKNVEHTKKCIEIAYELGVPCIRINTGRWNTTDFDTLMAHRGIEPILPGYTESDGFKWCIEGIQACLAKAEECGVILALENHWGLARTPEGLMHIIDALPSPWLGVLMDTGNFLESPYEKLEKIAPKTVFAQAKTYPGGGEWYSLDLDYKRIAKILASVGYNGYVSLEMEGKQDPDIAVPKSIAMLRKAFGV
ncbi:MAG TPA: sugar phosphate isomerase/epimerase family protein [Candidatus Limnocylindria bacterium]|jgi:sugar phosphate isomerase/epimerase|nr:sugar phosphate isomerase/epimerase family protein [Candidatus Limnocylindria bacterium]